MKLYIQLELNELVFSIIINVLLLFVCYRSEIAASPDV